MQAQPLLLPSWEGVQAGQVCIPRQAALIPHQPGRSAGSVSTHCQACSTNPQLRRSASSTGALSQADRSLSPSQGASGTTVGDGTSSPDNTAGIIGSLPSCDKLNLGLLGVLSPDRGKHTRRSQS